MSEIAQKAVCGMAELLDEAGFKIAEVLPNDDAVTVRRPHDDCRTRPMRADSTIAKALTPE